MPNNMVAPAPVAQKQVDINDAKKALAKQSMIDRALRGLAEKQGPITRSEVIDMCVGLVADQVFTAQAMAGYLADLPKEPDKIRDWVEAHAATVERNLDAVIDMMHGYQQ